MKHKKALDYYGLKRSRFICKKNSLKKRFTSKGTTHQLNSMSILMDGGREKWHQALIG